MYASWILCSELRGIGPYLYIQPEMPTQQLSITYNKNGGEIYPIDDTVYTKGNTVKVSSVEPIRVGYRFEGWFTEPTGGTVYANQFEFVSNVILYAQWTVDENRYKVKYNNSNSASMANTAFTTTPNDPVPIDTTEYKYNELVTIKDRTIILDDLTKGDKSYDYKAPRFISDPFNGWAFSRKTDYTINGSRWTQAINGYYDYKFNDIYKSNYVITGIGGGTFRIKSNTDLYISLGNGSQS